MTTHQVAGDPQHDDTTKSGLLLAIEAVRAELNKTIAAEPTLDELPTALEETKRAVLTLAAVVEKLVQSTIADDE